MAFDVTSHYDTANLQLFQSGISRFLLSKKVSERTNTSLWRKPTSARNYFGDLDGLFEQLNGKELSYNNLVDVDAAVNLVKGVRR